MNPAPRIPMRKSFRPGNGEWMFSSMGTAFCAAGNHSPEPVENKFPFQRFSSPRRENHARMREDHTSRENDPRNSKRHVPSNAQWPGAGLRSKRGNSPQFNRGNSPVTGRDEGWQNAIRILGIAPAT